MDWNLSIGFFLGIVGSGIAAVIYERTTSPLITITLDERPLALGELPGIPPYAFYHLKISNHPVIWFRKLPVRFRFSSRKPAWSSTATIEVFNLDGAPVINEAIHAGWPSQPEPLIPARTGDKTISLVDFARLMNARTVNIHSHEDQYISLAIKFDGQSECYIFSNESYLYKAWSKPEWQLRAGNYRIRVKVFL